MREPTPLHALYRWWAAALAGRHPPIHHGDPQPGFYKRKLVKGGVFVAARIWVEQDIDPVTGELVADERFCCEVDGKTADAFEQWDRLADHPITEAEFDLMRRRKQWATAHRPDHPIASPRAAVDWNASPIPF